MKLLQTAFLIEDYSVGENGNIYFSVSEIPITLLKNKKGTYFIDVNGENWLKTNDIEYATVLFDMIRENLTGYVDYLTYRNFFSAIERDLEREQEVFDCVKAEDEEEDESLKE